MIFRILLVLVRVILANRQWIIHHNHQLVVYVSKIKIYILLAQHLMVINA